MSRWMGFGLLAAVLVGGAAPAAQDTQESRPLAAMLPDDVFLVMQVSNVAQFRQRLQEAGLSSLLNGEMFRQMAERNRNPGGQEQEPPIWRPDFQALIEAVEGGFAVAISQPDMSFLGQSGMPFGQMPFGMPGEEPPAEPADAPRPPAPPLAMLAVAGGGAERLQEILTRGGEEAVRNGATRSEESFRGTTMAIYQRTSDVEGTPTESLVIAQMDGTTVVANDLELARSIVRLGTGGEGASLASNPRYTAVRNGLGEGLDATGYMNVQPLVQTMLENAQQQAEANPMGEVMTSMFEQSGVRGIEAAGYGLGVTSDSLAVRGYLHIPQAAEGFVRAVFARGANPAVPAFTTDDYDMVAAHRMDFGGLFETMQAVISPLLEQQGMTIDDIFAMLGIDVRADIIDNLNGDWVQVARAPAEGETTEGQEGQEGQPPAMRMVQMFSLRDEARFQEALETMMAGMAGMQGDPNGGPQEEEFNGVKIYNLMGQAAAVTGGYWIMGEGEAVREAIGRVGREGASLRDREELRSLASQVPEQHASVTYLTRRGFMRMWDGLRDGSLFRSFAGGMPQGLPIPGGAPEDVPQDPGQAPQGPAQFLPPASEVAGNLAGAVGYVELTETGPRFVLLGGMNRYH